MALAALGLLALGVAWGLAPSASPDEVELLSPRRTDGDGLTVLECGLRLGGVRRGRMVVVYADLDRVRPTLGLNPSLEPLTAFLGPAFVAVNAGYFTKNNRPVGLLASAGQTLHPFVPEAGGAGSGVLVIEAGEVGLIERDHVGRRSFDGAEIALQAGPRLIEADGRPGIRADDGQRAHRTVVGRDARGRLALAVVHALDLAGALGPTLFEMQRVLGPDGLGRVAPALAFSFALNLDGGPSSGLHARDPAVRLDLPPASRVVSVLTLDHR